MLLIPREISRDLQSKNGHREESGKVIPYRIPDSHGLGRHPRQKNQWLSGIRRDIYLYFTHGNDFFSTGIPSSSFPELW